MTVARRIVAVLLSGLALASLPTCVLRSPSIPTGSHPEQTLPRANISEIGAGQLAPTLQCNTPENAPSIAAWTPSAAPGQSVFLAGDGLTSDSQVVLASLGKGMSANYQARVLWADGGHLLAALPDDAPDGPYVGWLGRDGCWSRGFQFNVPELWWAFPSDPVPGDTLRLFGRTLVHQAGTLASRVYLEPTGGGKAFWLDVQNSNRYALNATLPQDIGTGKYRLWVYAGAGGRDGWSRPIDISVVRRFASNRTVDVSDPSALLNALNTLGHEGGGTVRLTAGTYQLTEPLRLPAGVTLQGAGPEKTVLRFNNLLQGTPGLVKPGGSFAESMRGKEPIPGKSGPGAVAAVLLLGSNSGLRQITILGNSTVEQGIAIIGTKASPIHHIMIDRIRLDELGTFHGTHGQTEGILARHVRRLEVRNSELCGNGPALYLEDVANSVFVDNMLSGQGEGVISGREGGIRRSIIERNHFLSSQNGAPQAVRALWLSTLFGSTFENYIANNRGSNFHPPQGTDQNRGEAILFETALTHPYFGHPVGSTDGSITLPKEGVDWPLLTDDSVTRSTRLDDYFVVVLDGKGHGQTRRVMGRVGETLSLDYPWRVVPDTHSTIVLTELFYRNLIVGNEIRDAMTGIQFWINGVDNVIAENRLADFSGEGILLFSNASGGPQSQPPFWPIPGHNLAGFNRGIGPNYFNVVQSNTVSNANAGIRVDVGDSRLSAGPVLWPLSMGNIVRGNHVEGVRFWGIVTGIREKEMGTPKPGFSVLGNIFEGNTVQDTPRAYAADRHSGGVAFIRNRANSTKSPSSYAAGLLLPNGLDSNFVIDGNVFQGLHGDQEKAIPGLVHEP